MRGYFNVFYFRFECLYNCVSDFGVDLGTNLHHTTNTANMLFLLFDVGSVWIVCVYIINI